MSTIKASAVNDLNNASLIPPVGGMMPWAGGASAPSGYLICDGAAVSRSTYAALFTAIGTTYGAGNGSTTFNLPKSSLISYELTSVTSVTLTNGGTTSLNSCKAHREGQFLFLDVFLKFTGAGSASPFTVTIPSSLTIGNMTDTTQDGQALGDVAWFDNGTAEKTGSVLYRTSTTLSFVFDNNGTSVINGSVFANGDWFRFQARVPIAAWAGAGAIIKY